MSEAQLKDAMYTAHATAVGGRNGVAQNSDGVVKVTLATPKSMGGKGGENTTTPEDLFATGYAACFGSACDHVARQMLKLNPTKIEVKSDVTIGNDVAGGYGLKVTLHVMVEGLSTADAEKLVQQAHTTCPYSKAIRGNVHVDLKVNQ